MSLVEKIMEYNTALLEDTDQFDNLIKHGGLSEKDVVENNIGWNSVSQSYTIPIKDGDGKYVDIAEKHLDDIPEWMNEIGREYKKVSFDDSIKAENYSKEITFDGIIIGKDLSPYLIPQKIRVTCHQVNLKQEKCEFCKLKEASYNNINKNFSSVGTFDYTFMCTRDREVILNFVCCTDMQVIGFVKRYFKIPDHRKCSRVKVEILERQNVEEILIAQSLDYDSLDNEYTIQRSFIFSSDIKTNAQYQFYGTTWNEPKTQRSTHILSRSKPSLDSISKWELTDEIRTQLQCFKAKADIDSIRKKLDDVHKDLAANITKIKKRNNIIMAVDLVYHSVLQFDFLGNRLTKGWTECLIGGDTRTGKSETVRNIVKHYRAGEYMTSGENVSLAGILGGVQQTHGNSRWSLTWGKIPLNDRGAVIIDESEELVKQEIMGHLSGVRSSGIAEVHKIQSRKTLARTRLIFIANPMHGHINEYNFGIDIVEELMGQKQDISRLDFAVLCSKDDVPDRIINRRDNDEVEHKYTSELCHNRVMFAWTRTPDQVKITKETEDIILQASNELGQKFSSDIPLVIGAEMRIKLARLSVAVAAMTYNTDKSGQIIIVEPAHAIVAISYLEKEYQGDAMGYLDYSNQRKLASRIKDEDILNTIIKNTDVVNELLNCKHIQIQDAEDIFSCDRIDARKLYISVLRKAGAIKKITHYYNKTAPFIDYLKRRRSYFKGLNTNPLDIEDDDE